MQASADVDGVRWVNRTITFLYVLDLALLVYDKRGAIGELHLLVQDAVFLRDLAGHVAKKRKLDSDFFGESGVGGGSIDADAKDRSILKVDLARVDTSLVCLKFFRSTPGEGKHVERQYDVLLATIVTQLYCRVLIAAQCEFGRHVSYLQEGV